MNGRCEAIGLGCAHVPHPGSAVIYGIGRRPPKSVPLCEHRPASLSSLSCCPKLPPATPSPPPPAPSAHWVPSRHNAPNDTFGIKYDCAPLLALVFWPTGPTPAPLNRRSAPQNAPSKMCVAYRMVAPRSSHSSLKKSSSRRRATTSRSTVISSSSSTWEGLGQVKVVAGQVRGQVAGGRFGRRWLQASAMERKSRP